MSRARIEWLAAALAALAAGCAAEPRFVDRPIVWRVDDDADIREPDEIEYNRWLHYGDVFFMDPLTRAFTLPRAHEARDLNAMDEVPDSTWFENRIGRYALTPDDVATASGGSPPALPLTITHGKEAGANAGVFVEDAEGRRFLVKFDTPDAPGMQSANAAIVSRLLWAAGYHVPHEFVFEFRRGDLAIGKGATYKTELHGSFPVTPAFVDGVLANAPPPSNGVYRALASELLPGKPKGGWPAAGVRSDDPNDVIAHEDRRSLRGLRVFAAWLDHTDMNPDNTLDVFVDEEGRHFLRHYLVDFGEALGAHAMTHPWVSYAYLIDPGIMTQSLFAFGMWKRPWEDLPPRPFPTVGLYFADFDPKGWREAKPYAPFAEMTAADAFWAAKIVMQFTRADLEAAVRMGKVGDPRAARYLVDTLWARRRAIGVAYMVDATALDRFEVAGDSLCMVDLSVAGGLVADDFAEVLDGSRVVERRAVADDGRVCVRGPGGDGYRVYRLRTTHRPPRSGDGDEDRHPPIEVHVRGGDDPRVVGVIRPS
jgi:hypothetical protein